MNSDGIWRLPKPSSSTSTPTPARQRSARAWTNSLATGPWPYAYWANVIVWRADRTASSMAGKICSPLSRRSTRFPATTDDDVYASSSAPSEAGVGRAEGSTTRGGRWAHAAAKIASAAASGAWPANPGRGPLTGSTSRLPLGTGGSAGAALPEHPISAYGSSRVRYPVFSRLPCFRSCRAMTVGVCNAGRRGDSGLRQWRSAPLWPGSDACRVQSAATRSARGLCRRGIHPHRSFSISARCRGGR